MQYAGHYVLKIQIISDICTAVMYAGVLLRRNLATKSNVLVAHEKVE